MSFEAWKPKRQVFTPSSDDIEIAELMVFMEYDVMPKPATSLQIGCHAAMAMVIANSAIERIIGA